MTRLELERLITQWFQEIRFGLQSTATIRLYQLIPGATVEYWNSDITIEYQGITITIPIDHGIVMGGSTSLEEEFFARVGVE